MLKLLTIISCLMIISSLGMPSTELPNDQQQSTETSQTIDVEQERENNQMETTQLSLPIWKQQSFLDKHYYNPIGTRIFISPETIRIHEPALAKIGDIVQRIPTAVSHQSQTIVHKHTKVLTPIVAPAVKTHTHEILRSHTRPLIYAPNSPYLYISRE